MKPQLDASMHEWVQEIESVSVCAAINTALAMDGEAQPDQGIHPTG